MGYRISCLIPRLVMSKHVRVNADVHKTTDQLLHTRPLACILRLPLNSRRRNVIRFDLIDLDVIPPCGSDSAVAQPQFGLDTVGRDAYEK